MPGVAPTTREGEIEQQMNATTAIARKSVGQGISIPSTSAVCFARRLAQQAFITQAGALDQLADLRLNEAVNEGLLGDAYLKQRPELVKVKTCLAK